MVYDCFPFFNEVDILKLRLGIMDPYVDRFVIEHGESLWKEYAVERTPIPHFCFGGKGMNTFTRLFRRIGCRPCGEQIEDYLIDYDEPCRGSDVYHVIRKSRI